MVLLMQTFTTSLHLLFSLTVKGSWTNIFTRDRLLSSVVTGQPWIDKVIKVALKGAVCLTLPVSFFSLKMTPVGLPVQVHQYLSYPTASKNACSKGNRDIWIWLSLQSWRTEPSIMNDYIDHSLTSQIMKYTTTRFKNYFSSSWHLKNLPSSFVTLEINIYQGLCNQNKRVINNPVTSNRTAVLTLEPKSSLCIHEIKQEHKDMRTKELVKNTN